MNGVTKKQAELLQVIKEFQELNGYTPTIRELAELTGRTSTPTHSMIENLVKRGRLRKIAGSARSLEIV
jgi:SOS-response transcriptional repressor LexA